MEQEGSFEFLALFDGFFFTRHGHLFIFTVIFAALMAAIYLVLKNRNQNMPFSRLVLKLMPYALPLFWFYSLIFAPPNNFAVARKYGFFSFWFTRIHDMSDIIKHGGVFLVLLGLGFVLLFLCYIASRTFSWPKTNPAITMIFVITVYLSAHIIRYIPKIVIDAHTSGFSQGLYGSGRFLAPTIAGILFMTIGLVTAGIYGKERISH